MSGEPGPRRLDQARRGLQSWVTNSLLYNELATSESKSKQFRPLYEELHLSRKHLIIIIGDEYALFDNRIAGKREKLAF